MAIGAQNPALAPGTAYSGSPADYQTVPQTDTQTVPQGPAAPTTSWGTVPGTSGTQDPSTWSSFTQGANQFLGTNVGRLATAAGVGGLGMYQANKANAEAAKLAGSISTLGQPYSQAGAQQLGQITPQLATGTAESATAANELGQVATQYGTGQLTPAQQLQVQTFVKQQQAQTDAALAGSGNLNSSARGAASQQIQNNAAMLTQQLIQGNIQIAQGALQAVQSTYSSMLNQALAQSQFGLGAQQAAVALQIQSNAVVSGQLQQLFSALATGLGKSQGGQGQGGAGGAGGAGTASDILKKLGVTGGGGGGVATVGNYPQSWTSGGAVDPNTGLPEPSSQAVPAAGGPLGTNPLWSQTDQQFASSFQMPNFNIDTGGNTGTVDVGQPTDTGAQSFGTGDGGGF